MGKDFRVGLITGVVLAGAALLWVATRPSLNPQARIPRAPQAAGGAERPSETLLPWASVSPPEVNEPQDVPQDSRLAQDPAPQTQVPAAPLPVSSQPASAGSPSTRTLEPAKPSATANATQDLTIYETNEPIKTTRFHIVRKGETLSTIAQHYYGAADKWRKILTANSKTVKNPNKIALGTKLIIPD